MDEDEELSEMLEEFNEEEEEIGSFDSEYAYDEEDTRT